MLQMREKTLDIFYRLLNLRCLEDYMWIADAVEEIKNRLRQPAITEEEIVELRMALLDVSLLVKDLEEDRF